MCAVIFLGLLTSRVALGEEGTLVELVPFVSWIRGDKTEKKKRLNSICGERRRERRDLVVTTSTLNRETENTE